MVGFALDNTGDIVIENGKIKMCEGTELLRQTCESVIGTNKGEWFLNENEGINYSNIIGKNIDRENVKGEVLMGLKHVRDDFIFQSYKDNMNKEKRTLNIKFTASADGEEIQGNYNFVI